MPAFKPIATDKKGNFYLKFENPKKTTNFYGQIITEQEMFKRHGCLPDNGVLANKLMNAVGRNVLNLEKYSRELDKSTFISEARKKDEAFYLNLEKESGANTAGLLAILAPLEKVRFEGDGDKKEALRKIKVQLDQHYLNRTEYLKSLLSDNAASIHDKRINRLITLCEENKAQLLNSVKINNSGLSLQTIYRGVMDRFSSEQRLISIYQGRTANQSATEAYQDASYTMEKHVFSEEKPTNEQLWQFAENTDKPILIDTRRYPSMDKEKALWSQELISGDHALENHLINMKLVEEAGLKRKLKEKTKPTVLMPMSRADDFDASTVSTSTVLSPITSLKDLTILFVADEVAKQSNTTNPTSSDDDVTADLNFTKGAQRLSREQALSLYQANDVLSALGCALADFGKYFEGKMAASHPAMSGAFFLLSAVTFGAAGLASMNVAMGKAAMHHLPAFLKEGVEAISKEWLNLTYSNGNDIHIIIMDMFALPKINYTVFDTLINGFEDKDTLTKLCEHLIPKDLEGKTRDEKVKEMMVKVVATAAVLGSVVALGLGASYVAAHGAGLAKSVADGVNMVVDIPTEAITEITGASGVAAHIVAVAAALLTIKSAGLLLGKGMMLVNHLTDKNTPPNEKDALMIVAQLYDFASQRTPEEFKKFIVEHPLDEKITADIAQGLIRHPEIRAQFGQEFFKEIGVQNVSRLRKAINMGRSVALGVLNSFVVPLFDVVGIFVAPLSALIDLGFNNPDKKSYGQLMSDRVVKGLNRLLDFLVGIVKAVIGLLAVAQFINISFYGSIQRAVTGIIDAVMDIRLAINAGIPAGFSILAKPFLVAGRYLASVTSLIVFPFAWAAGAVACLGNGKSLVDSVKSWHKYCSDLRATVVGYLKNKSKDVDYLLLKKAPDAGKITDSRDRTIKSVHAGFDWLKNIAGSAVYAARTFFLRNLEVLVQKVHAKKGGANPTQNEEESRASSSLLGNGTSYRKISEELGDRHYSDNVVMDRGDGDNNDDDVELKELSTTTVIDRGCGNSDNDGDEELKEYVPPTNHENHY